MFSKLYNFIYGRTPLVVSFCLRGAYGGHDMPRKNIRPFILYLRVVLLITTVCMSTADILMDPGPCYDTANGQNFIQIANANGVLTHHVIISFCITNRTYGNLDMRQP